MTPLTATRPGCVGDLLGGLVDRIVSSCHPKGSVVAVTLTGLTRC